MSVACPWDKCEHSDSGWCQDCVMDLWADFVQTNRALEEISGDIRPTSNMVVVDLDGLVCEETGRWDDYDLRKPLIPNIIRLMQLKDLGVILTLYTARHSTDFWPTIRWLQKWGLDSLFERVIFDKPRGKFYVDDRSGSLDKVLAHYTLDNPTNR